MEIDRRNILFKKVSQLLHKSRCQVVRSINTAMVYTYFEIGKLIIEEQQHGKDRAKYGKSVLKNLSEKLTEEVGSGFSVDNLENMRRFFLAYSNSETVSRNLKSPDFQLSWSHYLKFIRIDNPEERRFNEINPTP